LVWVALFESADGTQLDGERKNDARSG